ncbi:hypothetical protein [Leptospira licerasiae]|uniref:hypothetical protein n=1 Tax=Leptospira licerasiae TaxID=447106 RepID=UPI0010841516|nr:hypothetical protein [Leptospira licerasiae]TGM88998.1 hypothetical protein EHR05_12415 [Leptospira licerasiae]
MFSKIISEYYSYLLTIAVSVVVVYALIIWMKNNSLGMNSAEGIFIDKFVISKPKLDLIPNRLYEYKYGYVEIISENEIIIQNKNEIGTMKRLNQLPVVNGIIKVESDNYTVEVYLPWDNTPFIFNLVIFLGVLSISFTSPLYLIFLAVPFILTLWSFEVAKDRCCSRIRAICKTFSNIKD